MAKWTLGWVNTRLSGLLLPSAPLVVNDIVIVGSFVPDIFNNQMPAIKNRREVTSGRTMCVRARSLDLYTIPRDGDSV
ncbi:MAG: hypothetical protein CM1200mP25_2890 [Acidobacteriota bacterium]|nr:MAG: hypothetical protein CM1200mP25_2890 [Acidobacteriota bacterium]